MKQNYRNPQADAWYRSIINDPAAFPFSFTCGSVRYDGFSPEHFTLLSREVTAADGKEDAVLRFRKDGTLTVTVYCTHHFTHGSTEWKVVFANDGDTDSDILENAGISLRFEGSLPVLKGIWGDHTNWYRPYVLDLASAPAHFESNSGRATHVSFPYFNLEYGDGGCMVAIGWAGTWTADWRTDGCTTTCTARSVNGLHTRLKPGESIRTALFLCAPYTVRQESYATNYWRDWYITTTLPPMAPDTPLTPFTTCNLDSDSGLPRTDGSASERYYTWRPSREKMIAEDVKVDFRWFDAGWYVAPDGQSCEASTWWHSVGTWELDPAKWPGNTFRESTDFAREHGMRTLVWFEPERVTDPDNLALKYGYDPRWAIRREGVAAISNNIGDPDCFAWTVGRIKKMLTENRVEMYREDNNSDPAGLWKHMDSLEGDDRRGITECKFIDAHYRMWDEIIACTLSYGGCGFVDSCASGGGRNDLESMRRAVPLLRSDYDRTGIGMRLSMTSSFNKWIPFCGSINKEKKGQLDKTGHVDEYTWRASYLPAMKVDSQFVQDPDQNWEVLRFGLKEWKRVSPYLLKDFHVLTPWHTAEDTCGFTALSYFDAVAGRGVLLAFRQEQCEEDTLYTDLPYVDGAQRCTLTDEDTGETLTFTGEELRSGALKLYFAKPRTARLLWVDILPQ